MFWNDNKKNKLRFERLKERYKEFEKIFGKNKFNYEAFEERYKKALLNKIDLEIFFNAEEEALEEKYKIEIEGEKDKNKKENTFTKKVDKILEEYDERLKKYPYNNFYEDASYDLKYLYGALKLFYNHLFPYIETIFSIKNTNKEIYKEFEKFYNYFNNYCYSKEGFLPNKFQDLISQIKYGSIDSVEKMRINIFIETGKTFNELLTFINNKRSLINKDFININVSDQDLINIFKNKNIYTQSFLDFLINWIKNFLYDFRISEFK